MKFEIFRWDIVQNPCTSRLEPIAYFVPSLEFLDYSKKNNHRIRVNIRDSEYYDGDAIWAKVDTSMLVPNCRANFYDATKSLILIFDTNWINYPRKSTGNFEVNTKIIVPESVKKGLEMAKSTDNNDTTHDDVTHDDKHDDNHDQHRSDELDSHNGPGPSSVVSQPLNGLEIGLIVSVIVLFVLLIFGIYMCFRNNSKKSKK